MGSYALGMEQNERDHYYINVARGQGEEHSPHTLMKILDMWNKELNN